MRLGLERQYPQSRYPDEKIVAPVDIALILFYSQIQKRTNGHPYERSSF
jgi:hypothetical protein